MKGLYDRAKWVQITERGMKDFWQVTVTEKGVKYGACGKGQLFVWNLLLKKIAENEKLF